MSSYFQKKKRLLTSWTVESHMTPSTKYQRHNPAICKSLFALLHFCFVTREITCFFSPLMLMPWSKYLLRLLRHLSFCLQSLKMEETYTVSNLWRFQEKSGHKPGNQPWVTLWQIPPCVLLPFLTLKETMTWQSLLRSVTNFIQPYLHQFFNNSHSLNNYGKPLKRPSDLCQSCLEAINIGWDIRQINW